VVITPARWLRELGNPHLLNEIARTLKRVVPTGESQIELGGASEGRHQATPDVLIPTYLAFHAMLNDFQNGVITKAQTDGLGTQNSHDTACHRRRVLCLGWLLAARQTPSYTQATDRDTFDPSNGACVSAAEATRILSQRFRRCSVNCPPSLTNPPLPQSDGGQFWGCG
jgi:hypothetical protein